MGNPKVLKCSKCNEKVFSNAKFCHKCGKELNHNKEEFDSIEKLHQATQVSDNYVKIVRYIALLLLGMFTLFAIIAIATTSSFNINSFFEDEPLPKVLNVRCNSYYTGFLDSDERTKISVTVQNLGGEGNINIIGKFDQSGTEFDATNSRIINMKKNDVQIVEFDFDSSSFRSGKCIAEARVVR